MREVKFRGKRVDNDEWVYGWYSEDYGYAEILTKYNDCEVILETVGQYTGLRDRNASKIYEGDIVIDERENRAYIAFLKQEMGYVLVFEKYDSRLGHRSRGGGYDLDLSLEIIGNIHDNPELIKEKKNETDVMTDHADKERRMIYQFEHDPIEHCWNFRDDIECPMFRFANNGGYCNLSEKMIYNEWDELPEGMPDWCEIVRID